MSTMPTTTTKSTASAAGTNRIVKKFNPNTPDKPTRYGTQPRTVKKKKPNLRAPKVPKMFPEVNQRLKQIREDMGITQAELSNRIGVTLSMVKSVENTVVSPNLYYLIALSNAGGRSTDFILKGKEHKK